mmetsp:Transcript_11337/g.17439  ORF Transcript_11337/g.17439 Transcript_11337/m.17439 type:complete len:418 (+) Transcript_11337:134-1387(+)
MEIPPHIISMIGHSLLFMLALGMSATVDSNSLMTQVRNTKAISTGIFMQFIILPFLGFLTVKMFQMENLSGLMLLIVTSSPGGSFSNWWCSVFNADLALSITMTSISTVLAMVMLPLNLYVYSSLAFGDEVDVMRMLDFKELATSLAVVITAVTIGVMASTKKKSHNFNVHANYLGTFAGVCLAIMAMTIAITMRDEVKVWDQEWSFFVAVMIPPTFGLLLSNAVTTYRGLKKPERVTASIETSAQNCAIAISVALTMFNGQDLAEAICVPFFYGLATFLVIGTYCVIAWKAGWTKAPPSEPLWKVITCSYEVAAAEQLEKHGVEVQLADEDIPACGVGTCIKYCHGHEADGLASLDGIVNEDGGKHEKMIAQPAHKKESKQPVDLALDWLKKLGYQMKESFAGDETTSTPGQQEMV